jgi:hypothetical protein
MNGPGSKRAKDEKTPKDGAGEKRPEEGHVDAESMAGEEDPGAALDTGETETLTKDDVRSSET